MRKPCAGREKEVWMSARCRVLGGTITAVRMPYSMVIRLSFTFILAITPSKTTAGK